MIARTWTGRTARDNAAEYGAFLQKTAFPDYGSAEGNRGWLLLRRDADDAVEFTLVSFWDSMDAVRRYAGDDVARPKYYPEDRAYLLELSTVAANAEVVDAQVRF